HGEERREATRLEPSATHASGGISAALVLRDALAARGLLRMRTERGCARDHSTVIFADAVSWKPLSPVHSKSIVPLAVATVKKLRNGLAAIAGCRSALKISSPL